MTGGEIGLWALFFLQELFYFCIGYAAGMLVTKWKKRKRNQYAQKIH